MLAQSGFQLVKELKRSTQHKLSPYNEEKIRLCLEEMRTLYDANHRDVAIVSNMSSDSSSSHGDETNKIQSVLVRHAVLERNKRCLLAYHYARLMKIKEYRWKFGTVLPKDENWRKCLELKKSDEKIREAISDSEQVWFKSYCGALANFMQSDANERGGAGLLNLTHYNQPPKSLFLEVRCLEDFGEFETEDGSILHLTKDSNHLMYRSDCEPLISQGIVEHITT